MQHNLYKLKCNIRYYNKQSRSTSMDWFSLVAYEQLIFKIENITISNVHVGYIPSLETRFPNYITRVTKLHAVAHFVEALSCKPEGRGFDSRCCHWNLSLT